MPKGQFPIELRARGKRVCIHDRFSAKVDRSGTSTLSTAHGNPELGPCHLWTGSTLKAGLPYGQFQMGDRPQLAHRVAWFFAYGVWPENAAHRCDMPSCVRLDHLFEATSLENNLDMRHKGRSPTAKLTEVQVREIRQLREMGLTLKDLASRFRISTTQASYIVNRKQWGWLDPEHEPAPPGTRVKKLTPVEIGEIRSLYHSGTPRAELVRRFGVSTSTILRYTTAEA